MFKCKKLNDRFLEAVKTVTELENLPPDVKLTFYAYYKHATAKKNFSLDSLKESDIISSFKFNAWVQLRGISPRKAKKAYIKLAEKYYTKKNKN